MTLSRYPQSMALNRDLAMLVTEIDANLSHAESLTHALSPAQFNWRPEPGRWSIAECLQHLILIAKIDLEPLAAAIQAGHAANLKGDGPFTYGFLARKFIASMEPPITRRFKAPKTYLPPSQSDPASTLAEYQRIGAELRRLSLAADGLDLVKVKTAMPVLPALLRPFVKMALGARLTLITTHDRRHLWQAEQVRMHPDFPQQ